LLPRGFLIAMVLLKASAPEHIDIDIDIDDDIADIVGVDAVGVVADSRKNRGCGD
jgi:hypothetical protein